MEITHQVVRFKPQANIESRFPSATRGYRRRRLAWINLTEQHLYGVIVDRKKNQHGTSMCQVLCYRPDLSTGGYLGSAPPSKKPHMRLWVYERNLMFTESRTAKDYGLSLDFTPINWFEKHPANKPLDTVTSDNTESR